MKGSAAFVFVLFSTEYDGSQTRAHSLTVAPFHLECDKVPQPTSRPPQLITCVPRIASPPTKPFGARLCFCQKNSEQRLSLCGDLVGMAGLKLGSWSSPLGIRPARVANFNYNYNYKQEIKSNQRGLLPLHVPRGFVDYSLSASSATDRPISCLEFDIQVIR